MRNISFALTTEQVRNQTKTVTRRVGWLFLKPGMALQPIVKGQGIPKGGTVEKIGGPIRVVRVDVEALVAMPAEDLAREGFPHLTRTEFFAMFCASHKGCTGGTRVTRIEFEYVTAPRPATSATGAGR